MPLVHKKLLVMKKLTALIEQAPYETSLVGCVFRGRQVFDDDDPSTMVSLLEGLRNDPDEVVAAGGGNMRKATFLIMCQGWTKDDKVNPLDPVYALLGAVEVQLARVVQENGPQPAYPEDYKLGNLVSAFTPAPGIVRPPENNVSTKAFFYLPIHIEMAFNLSEPFISV